MTKNFKPDQIWVRKNGYSRTIKCVQPEGDYPVWDSEGVRYTREGIYGPINSMSNAHGELNLVSLVRDVEPVATDDELVTMDKRYKYRSGGPARVLCTDCPGPDPVISMNVFGILMFHCRHGRHSQGSNINDLIEVKPRIQRMLHINLYPKDAFSYSTKADAERHRSKSCIGYLEVPVDCEHGEGL